METLLSCFPQLFKVTAAKVPQEQKLKGMKVVCGANVPWVRKFHGTKVLGIFAPEERMFHGPVCRSTDRSILLNPVRKRTAKGMAQYAIYTNAVMIMRASFCVLRRHRTLASACLELKLPGLLTILIADIIADIDTDTCC